MTKLLGSIVVVLMAASACTGATTESVESAVTFDGAGIPVDRVPVDISIDDEGVVWMLDATADQWTIRASKPGAEQAVLDLGTGGSDRPQGFTLRPLGDRQALGRVECDGQACALSVVVASFEGTEIAAQEEWSLELEAEPVAVTVVGSDSDHLLVNVDDFIYRFVEGAAPSMVATVGGDSTVGAPCLTGAELLAPSYNLGAEGDEVVTGEIVKASDAGRWEPVAETRFAYDPSGGMEFICRSDRLELTLPDQVAHEAWVADGRRLDGAPSDIEWVQAPYTYDPAGLLGVQGTALVRLDSLTGETLARVEGTPLLQERWSAAAQRGGLALADTIALSPSGHVAAVCFDGSATDQLLSGTCVVWEA